MKKIRLFALAFLAMLGMSAMAQTITLSEVTPSGNWYEVAGVGRVTNKSGNAFSEQDTKCDGITGYKTGSSYFTVQTYNSISELTVAAKSGSNRTLKSVSVSATLEGSAASASNVTYNTTGGNTSYQIPKNTCDNEFTIEFSEPVAADSYIQLVLSGNADIVAVTFGAAETCTAPAEALALKADKTENVYEGDIITFSVTGGNGNNVKIYDGETEVTSPWTATAGNHSFTAAQEPNDTVCGAVTEAIAISVASKSPVVEAVVTGPNNGFIGIPVTLTCNAANATQYQWVGDYGIQIEGATEATYTFTPDAAGSYKFHCNAKNDFNGDNWVMSNTFTLEVTKLCGELIRATTQQEVSGVAGGSVETSFSKGDSKKLDKNNYFGVKLASGTFQAGDMFTINITAAADLGHFMLYADKSGSELVYDQGITYTKASAAEPVVCPTGAMTIVLPAAAQGKQALYIYRGGGNDQWNVTFDTVYVTRPCEASGDNTIAHLLVNSEEVKPDGNNYNYVVAASDTSAAVLVTYTLNHVLATATPASGFTLNVPAPGADATSQMIDVTAENGDVAHYTVSVTKAASLSKVNTLKALSVKGYTLSPAFADTVYSYTVTKEYGAENPLPADVIATPTDAAAKTEITADADTLTVTVTPEDAEAAKGIYKITVLTAAANKDLYEVLFSNGAKGAIDGAKAVITVPYLAGEDAPSVVLDSIKFASWAVDTPAVALEEGKLVITGADGDKKAYALQSVALAPATAELDSLVVFDTVPAYIFAPYGFDKDKGVKFAKSTEEKSNMRVSSGRSRIYMALPAGAKSVSLTSGSAGKRAVVIYVNGVKSDVTSIASSGSSIEVALDHEKANFIAIESNQTGGDGGFTKMQLNKYVEPQYFAVTLQAENGKIEAKDSSVDLTHVLEGTALTLVATPDEGYLFDKWEGFSETSNELTLTVTQDTTVKALFKEKAAVNYYKVTVVEENGKIAVSGAADLNNVEENTILTFTATPNENYEFSGWDGFNEATNVLTLTITADVTVKAIFKEKSSETPDVVFKWTFDGSTTTMNEALPATNGTVALLTKDENKTWSTESATYNSAVEASALPKKGLKSGGNALYIAVTLSEGSFTEGDVISIIGYNAWNIYTDTAFTTPLIEAIETGTAKGDYNLGKGIIPRGTYGNTLYMRRTNGSGTGIVDITVVHGSDIPEPVKYFTVTFLGFEDVVLKTQTVKQGEAASAPEAPVVEGYTFKEWDTDFSNVQSDLTVHAVYEQNTGLEDLQALFEDGDMYNILGLKVTDSYKGIVIKNGKKFFLK